MSELFIPKGFTPLADLVDELEIEDLRSQLASGEITAVEYWTRDGRMAEVARQVWLSNQGPGILRYARSLMDKGQVYLVKLKPTTREDKGGRPPKWDWPGAAGFAVGYIVENDYPATQGEMVKLITSWFTRSVREEPDDRSIQRFVTELYKHRKT